MFKKNTSIIWLESSIFYYLLGIRYKLIETDIFDIFFRFGIIGLMVYLILSVYLLRSSLNKDNNDLITIILILGHVLVKPSVSIVISIIIIKYLRRNDGSEKI